MRIVIASVAMVCAGLLLLAGTNNAGEKDKEVVLKGKITCAKCDLGVAKECATVIVVKDKETKKDITYYFDAKGHKANHDSICTEAKKGTVTGVVTEVDKKKIVTVKKIEFAK